MKFNLANTQIPHKIADRIIESVVEIRFDSPWPTDQVADNLFLEFCTKLKYLPGKDLPVKSFPADIREKDPQIKYLPTKELTKDGILLLIGGHVVALVNRKPYLGWEHLSKEINDIADRLKSIGLIEGYQRLGVRYVNFFDSNILKNTNLQIGFLGEQVIDSKINLHFIVDNNPPFVADVRITNNARIVDEGKSLEGSLVDIDVYFKDHFEVSKLAELARESHDLEKKIFFHLLKKEFIDSLNP
jgi:uncharacterized protein (TIGR04255 family)